MLDYIWIGFAELWATESKRKIQNENICLHRESNQRPIAFQRGASPHSAALTVNYMLLKLLYTTIEYQSTRVAMIYQSDFG